MSLHTDVQKIVSGIKAKIFLIVGRGTLKTSKQDVGTPKVQGEFLSDEIISDMERVEDYGFASYPEPGAQIVAIFVDGNREQGLAIRIHDRDSRPTDLEPGEACMYHKDGARVLMKKDGSIEIESSVGITLKTTDSAAWLPNVIPNCLFSGAPHGGPAGGISTLKGS